MDERLRKPVGVALAVALLAGVVVLATRPTPPRPDAVTPEGTVVQSRLQSVGYLHELFVEVRGRTPASFAEFADFGRNLPGPIGPMVFDEATLMLPRDGQMLVVRYGLKVPPGRTRQLHEGTGPTFVQEDGPVLAYEHTGVGGRRFVVYSRSNRIEEVDEERFRSLVGP